MPERIQRKRTKGWRLPPGAVYVGRPTRYGNPFTIRIYLFTYPAATEREAAEACVDDYRNYLACTNPADLEPLRGKDLACWCAPGSPCHADVLLELANRESADA